MAGATGAGKTHTMMGSERTGESVEQDHHTLSGIIPQVRGRLRWSMHEAKHITPYRLQLHAHFLMLPCRRAARHI